MTVSTEEEVWFADVIIPLAVRETYTYRVPAALLPGIQVGIRVEVAFGKKKLYAGLVINLHHAPPSYTVKPILSLLDVFPIISEKQIKLWTWLSDYYACGLGEVMHAALPSALKLSSETIIIPGIDIDEKIFDLDDKARVIAEAVSIQKELSIDQIRSILEIKTVYPVIKFLLENGVVLIKEELKDKYKPKQTSFVKLGGQYNVDKSKEIFEALKRAEKQTTALLAVIQLSKKQKHVQLAEVLKLAQVTTSIIVALEQKGLVERYKLEVSRIDPYSGEVITLSPLSDQQKLSIQAFEGMEAPFKPILLHGVTGSGKTRVYIELIKKVLALGKQVLYLLPEIALTTQIVTRLQRVFADDLVVYHSRLNEFERVEVWQKVMKGQNIVLGARSGLFLPFQNLGLIIVDEEHDQSYKQSDPAPRYQGRDASIMMAKIYQSRIILGSATPSLETYSNVRKNKYGLIEMPERFGQMKMPEISVVDLKNSPKSGYFSRTLLDEMEQTYRDGYQTILFQNRRGFAPLLLCSNCDWRSCCKNCDTSLTFHKYFNEMQCHLCGYHEKPALTCPDCGNYELTLKGFGTELIEDELKIRFPHLKIARLDFDTARGKKKLSKIIFDFEQKSIDILIGTQMVTKGLDFDGVGLVGIISADHLLYYPDFRAAERAFQLMTQVSGRSGRKHRRGKVIIQAYQIHHPVIKDVIQNNFTRFYEREIQERKQFYFPPAIRMIKIVLKHRDNKKIDQAAAFLVQYMRQYLKDRVKGPVKPGISRIRNFYIREVTIKMEKNPQLIRRTKDWLEEAKILLKKKKGLSTLRFIVNIDP